MRNPVSVFAMLGALGFVSACVAHEALGHGLSCLLTGGSIKLLTSVYFKCVPAPPFVDAAGPLMNLLVALAAYLAIVSRKLSLASNAMLALIVAFNAFWGSGYFVYSAAFNTGDLAYVLRDLNAQPRAIWRIAMGLAGIIIYITSLRYVAKFLPRGRALFAAYVASGVTACLSVACYSGPLVPALREAILESLVASAGLVYLSWLRRDAELDAITIASAFTGKYFTSSVAVVLATFIATLGRGFS